jgi:hypothetical protein
MPGSEGRSGEVGNSTTYHSIDIHTPNPGLLQPGNARPNKSSREVLGGPSGGWPSKKNYSTRKGGRGKSA